MKLHAWSRKIEPIDNQDGDQALKLVSQRVAPGWQASEHRKTTTRASNQVGTHLDSLHLSH